MKTSKVRVIIRNNVTESSDITRGSRQGDRLAPIVFDIPLNKVTRESYVEVPGTILNKERQIVVHAVDVGVIQTPIEDEHTT